MTIARLPAIVAKVTKKRGIRVITPKSKAKLQQINRSLSEFMYARGSR